MQPSNRWAFKEWAVVCEALATGRQSIILRKGGIHEGPAGFQIEHPEFWLFATRFHQNPEELTDEARPFLDQISPPEPGVAKLPAYACVEEVLRLTDERQLPSLAGLHILSEHTVSERFHYRSPGLFVLRTRIFVPETPLRIPDSPHFAGCRTWVDLPEDLATNGLTPVLSDSAFAELGDVVQRRFAPVA